METTRTQKDLHDAIDGKFREKDAPKDEVVEVPSHHYSPWLKEGIRLLTVLEQEAEELTGNSELYAELSDRVNRGVVELGNHIQMLKRPTVSGTGTVTSTVK